MAIKYIDIRITGDDFEEAVNAQSKLSDWFNGINESTGSDVTIDQVKQFENCASFVIEFPQTTIENPKFFMFMDVTKNFIRV